MKNNFNEKHKLPLSFKYAEILKKKKEKNKTFFIACDQYQTDFLISEKPYKSLIRLL